MQFHSFFELQNRGIQMVRWIRRLLDSRTVEAKLDAELRFHLDQQAAEYVARGMSPGEAFAMHRSAWAGLSR
jgi:hypothetical protein